MRGADQCGLPAHTHVCVVLHPGSQASLSGQDLGVGVPICPKRGFSECSHLQEGQPLHEQRSRLGPSEWGPEDPCPPPSQASFPLPETLTRLTKDNKSPGPQGRGPQIGAVSYPSLGWTYLSQVLGGAAGGSLVSSAPWGLLSPPPYPLPASPTHPRRMVRTLLDWLPGPGGSPQGCGPASVPV